MARPRKNNTKVSLRLTPAVDGALDAIARALGLPVLVEGNSPIGPVCVDAFRYLAQREGLSVEGWPEPLDVHRDGVVRLCRTAVKSASDRRPITRNFSVPTIVSALDELLPRVESWPRYTTKTRWNPRRGVYELVQRGTPAGSSLVQWAAVIEYLDAIANDQLRPADAKATA